MATEPGERPAVYGAAPERTVMAWQRTGLGVVVGSLLVLHTSLRIGSAVAGAGVISTVALALGLGAVMALAFPWQRYVRGEPAGSWVMLSVLAAAVMTLALLGGTIAFLTLLT